MPLGPQNIDLVMSLQQLTRGGLPTRARLRLAEEAGPNRKLFTSDLSVNEFLLTREVGVETISQVMGSSIYHVGKIADYKGKTSEIEGISQAHRDARGLALGRLRQEAELVNADAVIGVHLKERLITKGSHGKGGDDGDEVIEFTVVGTAVRAPWLAAGQVRRPVLTDLSGQDLWALAKDGFVPCGFIFDFCRYHVWHVMKESYQPQGEIAAAAAGVETARQLVADRVTAQAASCHAEFVVGSDITVDVHEVPCGWEGCHLNDLDIDVIWFGTAIRRAPERIVPAVTNVPPLILGMMPLGKRRKGDWVEGEEDESDELKKEAKEDEERAAEEADKKGGE